MGDRKRGLEKAVGAETSLLSQRRAVLGCREKRVERRRSAHVRRGNRIMAMAQVEQTYRGLKRRFGYFNTRYRWPCKKSGKDLFLLFALGDPSLVERKRLS